MRALLFCVAVMATACGDNRAAPRDRAPVEDAGIDGPVGPTALAACLDRPTDLSVAPAGQLPCELLPPGFAP
jgi:hypothetical protein